LIKTGSGTQTLSGANTYTGTTTVSNGMLLVNGSLAAGSAVTVSVNGALGGTGTVAGTVTVNGTLAPGVGVGTLATGAETWNGGGSYLCELNSTNVNGCDLLNITGLLNVQATGGNKFTIKLNSLTSGNTAGPMANFNKYANDNWTIATASSGITNFSTNVFSLDTSGFANDFSGGRFALAVSGNNLVLSYLGAPAPPVFTGVTRMGNGGMQLSGTGVAGQNYVLQGATNLLPTILWTPIATNPADTNGFFQFTDPQATNYLRRFYRVTTP
jgi:autotransporter-associated beta strand protein